MEEEQRRLKKELKQEGLVSQAASHLRHSALGQVNLSEPQFPHL